MRTDPVLKAKSSPVQAGNRLSSSRLPLYLCLALGIVSLVVFLPVRSFDFVRFDDPEFILKNNFVRNGLTAEGVAWAFRSTLVGNWHPLTCISHMLDCQLLGINSGRHHLVNVLFHVANTILLFLVLRRMTGAIWRSAFVAALFALHPLHVESVAWISERKDLLSGFFWLLTMWFYARFVEFKAQGSKFKASYILALLFFGLGLLSKPMVVTLPCVLLLLDFWPLNRVSSFKFQVSGSATAPATEGTPKAQRETGIVSLLVEKIPFFALAGLLSAITIFAQEGAFASQEQMPLNWRVGNALIAYGRYIKKMFWPVDLMFLYPHPGKWPSGMVLGSTLFLIAISLMVIWLSRRHRYVLVGWLWYLGTLVPVIGFVQVGMQSMADRYTYIPLIGLFIVFIWGSCDAMEKLRLPKIVFVPGAVAMLAACIAVTMNQLSFWKDSAALYHHGLEAAAHDKVYRMAVQNPIYVNFHTGICTDMAQGGEPEKAEAYLRDVVKVIPANANVRLTLGTSLAMQHKWDEAANEFLEAARLNPKGSQPHVELARVRAIQKKLDEAIEEFSTALKLQPDDADAHFDLAFLLEQLGRRRLAITHYQEALRYRPDFSEAQQHLKQLSGR